ncbi:MAG: hypothetical protein QM775_25015 [Pirellulales bacterium]
MNPRMGPFLRCGVGLLLAAPCCLWSIWLEGGHPEFLLGKTAALILGLTAIGGMLALRGAAATGRVLGALAGFAADRAPRAQLLADVGLLERLTLLGACLGTLGGGLRAVASYETPQQVGPALAIAIQSLVLGSWFTALVILPCKQRLFVAGERAGGLAWRAAGSRAAGAFGVLALAVAGTSAMFRGTGACAALASPVLMLLGTTLPSLLAAPRAILGDPVAPARCRWFADAMLGAGTATVACGVAHCFAVLDQPRMLPPGIAAAFAGFALPALLATLTQLRGQVASAAGPEPSAGERSPHGAFAAMALLALAGMVVMVAFLVQHAP